MIDIIYHTNPSNLSDPSPLSIMFTPSSSPHLCLTDKITHELFLPFSFMISQISFELFPGSEVV
jgi:hypothetical protein